MIAGGVTVAAGAGGAQDAPTTETFGCTGSPVPWVVPDDVTQVTVEAFGAAGGRGWREGLTNDPPTTRTPGGLGGRAAGTVAVTPGATLLVTVGCVGSRPARRPPHRPAPRRPPSARRRAPRSPPASRADLGHLGWDASRSPASASGARLCR